VRGLADTADGGIQAGAVAAGGEDADALDLLSHLTLNAQLFHLGQEAIANAISHAEPTRLIISIDYQSDSVRLKIVDNGRGFTMRGDLLGFGIRGMRKRASEIGGDLDITSSPGAGTSVSIAIQLPEQKGILSPFITARKLFRTILESKTYAGDRD
jgi:signal transduction histidine kinase